MEKTDAYKYLGTLIWLKAVMQLEQSFLQQKANPVLPVSPS